jgi:Lon protease-like protein
MNEIKESFNKHIENGTCNGAEYIINFNGKIYHEAIGFKDLEKKNLSQTLNDLSMASPFSLEEKQILLESLDINIRKEKMEQILNNYIKDEFENTTLQ